MLYQSSKYFHIKFVGLLRSFCSYRLVLTGECHKITAENICTRIQWHVAMHIVWWGKEVKMRGPKDTSSATLRLNYRSTHVM
jgi:hypothetical protein